MDFSESLQTLMPGATGKVLAALSGIYAPLSGRAIAQAAGVSHTQAGRVLSTLVDLGVVETQPAPPATLYVLSEDHVATRHLRALQRLDDELIESLGDRIATLQPAPVTVAVFGSFARREAGADSDIDLLVVRSDTVDEENDEWRDVVEAIIVHTRKLSGNAVDVVEAGRQEAHDRLRSRRELWRNIRQDARVVRGVPLDSL